MNIKQQRWVYLGVLSIIWGSSFILIKKALIGLTPLQLGALRVVMSALFLFLIGFSSLKTIKRNEWKWIVVSSFLGTFFPAFLFAYAETEIDSAIASILNSLVPLNTLLLGFLVFKLVSTKRQILGVIIGFLGTAILILKGAELNPDQNYMYAGFVILATLMYAANVNIIKKHMQHISPMAIAVGNFAIIFIPAIIVLLFSDFFTEVVLNSKNLKMSIFYVVILSVFGTGIAKVMFNKLIQISSPVFASSVTYLMPLIALFWGVFDGEFFNLSQLFATVIILLGVYLANKK